MKNIDKQKFLVYGISLALFSTITFTIISLFDLNDVLNLGGDAESVKIVFLFYDFVIAMAGFLFMIYSIRLYEISRMKDYGLFLILGSSKKKCLFYMLIEFGLIFFAATVLGISFGMILMKFISIVFMLNGINAALSWDVLIHNSIIIMRTSLILEGLSYFIGLFGILKKDVSKTFTLNCKKEQESRILCIFTIIGVILFADSIKQLNHATFGRILFSLFECLTAFYFFVSFGLSFIFHIYGRFLKESFQKNILKITDFRYRYKTNKTLLFIIFAFNMIVIFFSGGVIITTYQTVDDMAGGMLVLRISSYFMASFTMICSMGILFLKQMNDMQYKQNNIRILTYLGMDEKTRKKYAVCDFKIILVSSVLLSSVIVWFYIAAECHRAACLNMNYIVGFALFELFIIGIQFTYYQITKSYLVQKIMNNRERW